MPVLWTPTQKRPSKRLSQAAHGAQFLLEAQHAHHDAPCAAAFPRVSSIERLAAIFAEVQKW